MQPYIFPYLGYFQLIQSVDIFVFYNDANFMKHSWINRNRILLNNSDFMFTIPCSNISPNRLINEVDLYSIHEIKKVLKTIQYAYTKAPFFHEVFPVIKNILVKPHNTISELAIHSVKEILSYLDVERVLFKSSNINYNRMVNAQDKIISICKNLNANEYINMIGGCDLYNKSDFLVHNLSLKFLKPTLPSYKQFSNDFVSGLSIIDVLMFNEKIEVIKMLESSLIEE